MQISDANTEKENFLRRCKIELHLIEVVVSVLRVHKEDCLCQVKDLAEQPPAKGVPSQAQVRCFLLDGLQLYLSM